MVTDYTQRDLGKNKKIMIPSPQGKERAIKQGGWEGWARRRDFVPGGRFAPIFIGTLAREMLLAGKLAW